MANITEHVDAQSSEALIALFLLHQNVKARQVVFFKKGLERHQQSPLSGFLRLFFNGVACSTLFFPFSQKELAEEEDMHREYGDKSMNDPNDCSELQRCWSLVEETGHFLTGHKTEALLFLLFSGHLVQ